MLYSDLARSKRCPIAKSAHSATSVTIGEVISAVNSRRFLFLRQINIACCDDTDSVAPESADSRLLYTGMHRRCSPDCEYRNTFLDRAQAKYLCSTQCDSYEMKSRPCRTAISNYQQVLMQWQCCLIESFLKRCTWLI